MTGVPPQAGSGHSPSGLSQSPLSQAQPSVPNAAFTPGPWVAHPSYVEAPGKGTVATIQNPWNDKAELQANARLIAAAPELYAALKGLTTYAEAVRHTAGMGKNQLARLEAAKAALAKAVQQ